MSKFVLSWILVGVGLVGAAGTPFKARYDFKTCKFFQNFRKRYYICRLKTGFMIS